ncbi:MAG: cysteine--tRNA ligase [Candidatus Saccharibacteria bacterium]
MTLQFHNTLTGEIDKFESIVPGKVSIYTCGPTVYDYPHIGNWVAYIYWDTLVRVLMANDYDVTRVMNITDVGHLVSDADEGEDKLEKGARREGKTAWEVAKFYTNDFLNGMKQLGLVTPQFIAKATDYIPDQIKLVQKLVDKGYTYQIDDGIYFDTSKFPTYADFAHLNLDAQKAGARVEFNQQKRNASDFALWKFTPAGEKRDMEWLTPQEILEDGKWNMEDGKSQSIANSQIPIANSQRMGFPGWHIECSAIAMSILGETLDIHTGGIDHIPVHHTNEIAQSESATGVIFSNYWLHNNHLKVNNTKISKSLGNGYTLKDLQEKGYSPLDFRLFVLQSNYRKEGNFTFDNLQSAKNRLHNWRNIAALRHQIHDTLQSEAERAKDDKTISLLATSQAIIEALNDDLGTPQALKIIDEAFARITRSSLSRVDRQSLIQLLETIDSTLGLQLIDSTPDISDEEKKILLLRKSARERKDWDKSDELRDELLKLDVIIRDTNSETVWEYKI